MTSRVVLAFVVAALMVVSGSGTYIYLARHQSKAVAAPPQKPTAATPRPEALVLPGTLYLTQSGALYSLTAGRFHQLTPEAGWTQPSASPDGTTLLMVKESSYYSDVYQLNRFGTAIRQLTNNQYRYGMSDPSYNHWSFYPRFGLDGQTVWMAYDGTKGDGDYVLMLNVWAMPINGTMRQARGWTNPNFGTGGDVQPVPVPQGGIVYTKYDYDAEGRLSAQLWFTNRVGSYGHPLTDLSEDCREPSVSPDGSQLAMICTYVKQVSYLTIASWNGSSLGPRKNIVTNQLVAQPTWAPDGSGIAYLAPAESAGPFQLWWLPKEGYVPYPAPPPPTPVPGGPRNGTIPPPTAIPTPPPAKPVAVTTNDGFDATSPLAWFS